MDLIILYIIAILLVFAVLAIGYLLNGQARICFNTHKNETNSKGLTSNEFAEHLFKHNKLRNISLITLRAKKTNYYSAKYNVIKVTPEVANSIYLFDLAICAKCTNKAIKQQYNYISSTIKMIANLFTKIISFIFIPVVLIAAILNISFGLENASFLITLITIILYLLAFVIQLILHCIEQSSVKKNISNIKNAKILEDAELKTLEYYLIALNKFEFFDWTRISIKIFTFLSPATIFDKSSN